MGGLEQIAESGHQPTLDDPSRIVDNRLCGKPRGSDSHVYSITEKRGRMETNWTLVRDVLNAAIDSCEALERAGYIEQHRGRTVAVNGQPVSVQDFLVSAWTLPESARYAVIRQRHEKGIDSPYVPETARILTAVTAACVELIGAGKEPPGGTQMQEVARWYRNHFDPHMKRAVDAE
jgi:hypothetical protein